MNAPLRTVLLVAHTGRAEARIAAREVVGRFVNAGVKVRVLAGQADALDCSVPGVEVVDTGTEAAAGCELVVVVGGDGTLLRGSELAHPAGVPLLGVNLGHVGFLAEAERADLATMVDRVVAGSYDVEERLTLDIVVRVEGEIRSRDFALNDGSVEKVSREKMLEVLVEVDQRPLSRFGCDGVVFSTPTGSTAYAFSAGGPVVWPDVDALLLVPISAHALFARPLVVSPRSRLAVELQGRTGNSGVLWCDGRRSRDLPPGARVEVCAGPIPIRLARLGTATFTDRLVAKFTLPVGGWRGAQAADSVPDAP